MTMLQGLEAPTPTQASRFGAVVYRKTEAGHAELQQRAASSSALRLRWALVMIDGRTPAGHMVERLGSIGIDEAMFTQLELLGFIEPTPVHATPATDAPTAAPVAPKPGPRPPMSPAATVPATARAAQSVRRLAELEAFFAGTIRELIGLRGLMLQLAAERAATLEDYRALRDRYVAAIAKARGPVLADALGARLDALLR